MNIAFDEEDTRGFVKTKLLSLALTLGFLVLVSLVAGVITIAAGVATGPAKIIALIVGWAIVAIMFGLFLALLYRYGPNRAEPKWVWVSPGSIFAVTMWTVMTIGFGITSPGSAHITKPTDHWVAIVVTLTWMYLTAVIVVIGAEITTEIERQAEPESIDDSGS